MAAGVTMGFCSWECCHSVMKNEFINSTVNSMMNNIVQCKLNRDSTLVCVRV